MEPAPHAAVETGHTEQASAKERTPVVRQEPAARTTPRVETAESPTETAQPKASTAIAYEDQQAVVAKLEAETKHRVQKTAKPKAEAAPEHHAPPAAEPKPVASERHAPAAAEPKPEVTSKHHAQKARTGTAEVTSAHPAQHVAKRKVEVASTEKAHNKLPFSTRPASPTEDGSQTLTRALGLKVARIVIDPGHGGFDTGTIGPTGLEEKNIVLDIGLRLRKLIETQTDSQVFMTRSTDKFIPLEERTAIANEDRADLFISIHANASRDHHVRGIETYFLNFTSDPEALRLAARENATSQESVHQLQNLIKKIALNNKIEESQELARDIQTVLYKHMSHASHGIHNRGVRKAPFVVLIGANMPSVLAEISFLSNAHSEHLLRESSYREQIAKALFRGIEDYISNLGSVRVAQRRQ
jgi:N-acetylmuramoyl-L-alanine amidase